MTKSFFLCLVVLLTITSSAYAESVTRDSNDTTQNVQTPAESDTTHIKNRPSEPKEVIRHKPEITFYPFPAENGAVLNIKFFDKDNYDLGGCDLYDILGNLILRHLKAEFSEEFSQNDNSSSYRFQLDFSDQRLRSGIYFIKFYYYVSGTAETLTRQLTIK